MLQLDIYSAQAPVSHGELVEPVHHVNIKSRTNSRRVSHAKNDF
jgi:hypothetical protein